MRRWMTAGPEVSHLIAEFESIADTKDAEDTNNHEPTKFVQLLRDLENEDKCSMQRNKMDFFLSRQYCSKSQAKSS